MARIALVAAGNSASRQVEGALAIDGHSVSFVKAEDGLYERVMEAAPELVLFDCDGPGGFCEEALLALCEAVSVPVIVLGTRYSEKTVVDALSVGADACLFRPFGTMELRARIKACLRRYWVWGPAELDQPGSCPIVNAAAHSVVITGKEIQLTPAEYRLLSCLIDNPGRVVSREDLCDHVWGVNAEEMSQTNLNLCVYNLRQKLEKDPHHPEHVRTKWGTGYFLGSQFKRI